MRDLTPLAFTLLAMRRLGDDGAHMVREGRTTPNWYAGPQPLNGQAVRDLLNDGWLRFVAGSSHQVRIDAWPNFATVELQGAEFAPTGEAP